MAEAAIDLTAVAASVARATQAVAAGAPTAAHEAELVNLLAEAALPRLQYNIAAMRDAAEGASGAFSSLSKRQGRVADAVLAAGGPTSQHPLGL